MSPSGVVYFADGSNIRMVDEHGLISTLIGHQYHRANWKPMPCDGAISIRDVQLNWPTELAISPLDNSLHFIDDNVVLKVTRDERISVVAGRPLHCPPAAGAADSGMAAHATLVEPQSLSFAPNGDLFVAESDSQRINRIRKISTDGKISTYAGADSKCNCLDVTCKCFSDQDFLAANVKFSAIAAIACAPDGVLYIADQGNYRLRAVSSSIPPEQSDGVFEVPDSETQELYIFNKFGQHVLTKDIMTSNVLVKMIYSQATSNGKLSSVTDASGNKLTIMRDYKGQVNALQTSNGHKYNLKMSRVGDLEIFETPTKAKTMFKYLRSKGLRRSKRDSSNKAYVYEYDEYGRLINAITPTGEAISLEFNLTSVGGAAINVRKDGEFYKVYRIQEDQVSNADATEVISIGADKTLTGKTTWSGTSTLATISHPVIAKTSDPVMADSFPMVGEMMTYLGSNLVNKVEWEYKPATNGHNGQMMGIQKTMKVNGENLLTLFFDKLQRREVLYAGTKTELLEVRYDSLSRPIKWEPRGSGEFLPVNQGYDRFGHLNQWSWGDVVEKYEHDKSGRLSFISRMRRWWKRRSSLAAVEDTDANSAS